MKMPKVKIDKRVSDLVARNILWGVMVIVLAMFYIHNGFGYERQMREISELKNELRDKEYKFTVAQKRLNGIGIRSNVKLKLAEANSEVKDSKKPNIRIE